tara:strand:+ start:274 stop:555 length:282 start_codon:yes stop_codon:yes gene_type:complete
MKIDEIMERCALKHTGRGIAYIKDALNEMNYLSETHVKTARMDIKSGKRFYELPNEAVKITDIRCKNHNNADNSYQSIPRSIYKPETEDSDGV